MNSLLSMGDKIKSKIGKFSQKAFDWEKKTEKIIKEIESYNINAIPPSLEKALKHQVCNRLGKQVNLENGPLVRKRKIGTQKLS